MTAAASQDGRGLSFYVVLSPAVNTSQVRVVYSALRKRQGSDESGRNLNPKPSGGYDPKKLDTI